MRVLFIFCLLFFLSFPLLSQEFGNNTKGTQDTVETDLPIDYSDPWHEFDIGLGLGLDYGGVMGAKFTYLPFKHFGFFASFGYHSIQFGWQLGAIGYFIPNLETKTVRPYAKLFYGTNRAILVEGDESRSKVYYGLTTGIGTEFRFGKWKRHGLNIDLNFMINSAGFQEDYDALKNNPNYNIGEPLPFAISFGYHVEF